MSQNSPPQSTPKWLQDLKQGRTQDQGAAPNGSPDLAGMAEAEAGSGEASRQMLDLRDRLSVALLSLHRRATSLTDDPVEAAKLIQESCLTLLAEGLRGDAGSPDTGADPEARFGEILEVSWREQPSQGRAPGRSFDGVQKMAPQTVEDPPSIDPRPSLRHIATVLRHLPRAQQDILIGIAGAGGPGEITTGATPERTISAFHRSARSGATVEREHRLPLPKVILLALLIPFLDPKDQAALEREDVTSVLLRCAAALRKDLETPGPELLNAERIGALLVQLLLREIIPDQIAAAGPLGFPDATIEQDDLVSLLFDLAASASATHDRCAVAATPDEDTDPTRGKPDRSADHPDAIGIGSPGPVVARPAVVMPSEGFQHALDESSSDTHLPWVTASGTSIPSAMRPKRLPRTMGSRLRAVVRSDAH